MPAALLRRLLGHERGTQPAEVRYRYKSVRIWPRNQAHVVSEWEAKGWEIAAWEDGRFRGELILRQERPIRRWAMRTRAGWLVMGLVAALLISLTGVFAYRDQFWGVRADARAAIRALKDGDLVTLDKRLAANRGRPDFAYFFASKAKPRDLGDALATVAGPSDDEPFKAGVDTHAYELALTDLAGTLALATHGTGDRSMPGSWTSDFILATTTPVALYGEHDGFFDQEGKRREKQDLANKSNLLLLLSRGYWSSEFLQAATKSYYAFDRREGDDAWPNADPDDDVGYAPAPSGAHLTDGVLALTAALTANPAASEWAFTDFQPDTVKIDGSNYSIGKFTHYLMFEHRFPESSGSEGIGMTTTLTALSSAIDSASWAEGTQAAVSANASSNDVGPMHDAAVLQALAHDLAEKSGCSWNPLDYGHCAIDATKAVWRWVQHWGHLVLDILSLSTFAPPPFSAIGVAAAVSNATWYAIEGDYSMAGLSLAAAVPGLAFAKIAKGATATKGAAAAVKAEKAATKSDDVAKAAQKSRAIDDIAEPRVALRVDTKAKIRETAPKTADGDYLDPYTGQVIPREGPFHYGHKPGFEWKCTAAKARVEGWTREQLIKYENDPTHYQIEDPISNMSHKYERAC